MSTTRVLVILSLTTTPSRVFLSGIGFPLRRPSDVELAFPQYRLHPGQITTRLTDSCRILRHSHRELEPQIEELLGQLLRFLLELVAVHLAPLGRFHCPCLRGPASGSRTWS